MGVYLHNETMILQKCVGTPIHYTTLKIRVIFGGLKNKHYLHYIGEFLKK